MSNDDTSAPVSAQGGAAGVLSVACSRCADTQEGLGSVGVPCCEVGAGRVQQVCVERVAGFVARIREEALREVTAALREHGASLGGVSMFAADQCVELVERLAASTGGAAPKETT